MKYREYSINDFNIGDVVVLINDDRTERLKYRGIVSGKNNTFLRVNWIDSRGKAGGMCFSWHPSHFIKDSNIDPNLICKKKNK